MASPSQRADHQQWLLELTGIPTAAGREDRVIAWVERWVAARKSLHLKRDAVGNLLITQTAAAERDGAAEPLYITAHLDHPAFVVRRVMDEGRVEMEFRGGVQDAYFENAAVEIIDSAEGRHRASITHLDPGAKPFKRAVARLEKATADGRDAGAVLSKGDIARWAFTGLGAAPEIADGRLHAPACDDLAGVAAALAALAVARRRKNLAHVGVLLTVAEEVGFIGAIGACKHRSIPKRARLLCLETSRSFPESPIGAGPIVRVGDKSSVFGPNLTNRISAILGEYQKRHKDFKWQRRLMPGGTCEATTFSAYGYESTCLCLALGNYHNMADIDGVAAGNRPARIEPEIISIDDYHGLIDALVISAEQLDRARVAPLRDRMENLYKRLAPVTIGAKA